MVGDLDQPPKLKGSLFQEDQVFPRAQGALSDVFTLRQLPLVLLKRFQCVAADLVVIERLADHGLGVGQFHVDGRQCNALRFSALLVLLQVKRLDGADNSVSESLPDIGQAALDPLASAPLLDG